MLREQFPILAREHLVYLDSANTSQKPLAVLDAVREHDAQHNANVARAMHALGAEATAAYEGARGKVASFVGAARPEEIVFTKNASEALNLCAHTLGSRLQPGDEVCVTVMEHHSNIVPWQLVCERTGATLRWLDIDEHHRLDLSRLDELVNERTKVVSMAWVSNVLGVVNPVDAVVRRAREVGAVVVLDGAQGVPHLPTDVAALGADLVAFTGHKLCGPTGIGVLWGRYDLLAELPPFLGGGEMIEIVRMERSTFAAPPHRFEAGTPPITQAVGLGAAVDFLTGIGMDQVAEHDHELTRYGLARLAEVPGLRLIGPADDVDRVATFAFELTTAAGEVIHPHDVMQLLDSRGIAVRGGHHCARPLHERLGVQSSVRASAYLYTDPAEIDALAEALVWVGTFFGGTR